ncbi:serine carboxypeptidase-like 12 isoform X2 [Carex rostrata]
MDISRLPSCVVVILFCIFHCFPHATTGSIVTHLPGFHGPLPFSLETGYVTVDEENGANMFYYFIESEGNPSEDPVLVWFAGGTRCSGLHSLSFQTGPLQFIKKPYNGSLPQLVANVIFLDSPIGTGFSYSSNPKGYDIDDITAGIQVVKFIRKWLMDHPQYLSNPLYVGGHSYAGKMTPYIAELISEGVEAGQKPLLNFKGYVIGNPGTGEWYDSGFFVKFAHGMGIISDQLYQLAQQNCKREYNRSPNKICAEMLAAVNNSLLETNEFHVLEPKCDNGAKSSRFVDGSKRYLSEEDKIGLLQPSEVNSFQCREAAYTLQYYWANENLTRDALHIKKGTVEEWERCNADLPYTHDLPGTIQFHNNLTKKGYRAFVYR